MKTKTSRISALPDIDWKCVATCRQQRKTWKQIEALVGIDHQKLRVAAAALKKRYLLGRKSRIDWSLIARLYRQDYDNAYIAQRLGLASANSLAAMIRMRRLNGRWTVPLRPRDRRAAFLKRLRETLSVPSTHELAA